MNLGMRQNRCETSRFEAAAEKRGNAYFSYASRIGFVIRCPRASICVACSSVAQR
jgi:hypothetical protein